MLGEYTLSIADVERVLALEPRHFGALAGLGYMFEQMGDFELALSAMRAAQAINPNRSNIGQTIDRLERETGAADL
jgi:Flp pilus assembly protein TadD